MVFREGAFGIAEVKRIVRPTDVPDTGLICDFLWADPDKDGSRVDSAEQMQIAELNS